MENKLETLLLLTGTLLAIGGFIYGDASYQNAQRRQDSPATPHELQRLQDTPKKEKPKKLGPTYYPLYPEYWRAA